MSAPFRHRLRVRFGECDPQGIVFNPNYLAYADVALTELFREAAGSYAEVVASGTDMVMVESRVTYRAPARADDLLDIELAVGRVGTTSMRFDGRILRDGDELTALELHYVAVDPATHAKQPIAGRLAEVLERFRVDA
ncbi:MAG TPA: thioesterase family protein [Capillimicrobium sp.]